MNKVSISNIAWPQQADDDAVRLAAEAGFTGIELAPSRICGDEWGAGGRAKMADYRVRLADLGLEIPAFQAILYGIENCELFVSPQTRANLKMHLTDIARLAASAGAKACVFGAPKCRDPGPLSPDRAFEVAVAFFQELAQVFEDEGTTLAFEPVVPSYGCRFITGSAEAVSLIRAIDRPGIRAQLDTGTVFSNGEGEADILAALSVASHFHASEPDLAPVGTAAVSHDMVAKLLARAGYRGWRSVEMKEDTAWRENVIRAASVMSRFYNA